MQLLFPIRCPGQGEIYAVAIIEFRTPTASPASAAAILHGDTMLESGVSKQVTVRFEDWPEEEQAAA